MKLVILSCVISVLAGVGLAEVGIGGLKIQQANAQDACSTAPTQQALNRCATQTRRQADQDLKDFLTTYQTRLSSTQVTALQHTQASWELYRRFSCEFEASGVAGGSAYPLIFSNCMTAKATARLSELQELSQCEEGNLSCPAPDRSEIPASDRPMPRR